MSYANCIQTIAEAAGRPLTDKEVRAIFERVHQAALDIKAGRASAADIEAGKKLSAITPDATDIVRASAERAAADLMHEAQVRERQANLQVVALGARSQDASALRTAGLTPLEAVRGLITRDYSGRVNVESLEQRVAGHKAALGRKLLSTWDALGNDWLGFFQSRDKLHSLVRELRGEDSGDAMAKKGAKAFHEVAEQARKQFNAAGGDVGRLDDWGMPQHHSQEMVARAGRDTWIDAALPMLDRSRYVDELGVPWGDARMREFLGKAWATIATNGHANMEPGQFQGSGKRANRHSESRQIHFKDADSVISYWERFGERTPVEILMGHIDTMARDIAFIEQFGPNPNMTYKALRDSALRDASVGNPAKTSEFEGRAVKLDSLWAYASGNTTPSANLKLSAIADGIANLNIAGKLGGAALASFFGDKPMMEAVAHLNNLPMLQRWRTELSLLNPRNASDRLLLQQQGLMLEGIRSGLTRFYEGLGKTGWTGKLANAVMRATGMSAINDIRKGSFGLSLMHAIGNEVASGRDFATLGESDIRALRHWGITEADWKVWQLAKLDDLGHGNTNVLTPEAVARIPDADMQAAGLDTSSRNNAIVKLLGAVNTESDFAIVTPGWSERSAFYADLQRGTMKGEVMRSVLQFKAFPFTFFERALDATRNSEGPVGKAMMVSSLILGTTLAGAMLLQTREMLAGKDPREMMGDDWYKFWAASFLQGGALGIYGDFIYSANQNRYGSGPIEALAGPTLGPLLEIGLSQPLGAARALMEGKDYHFLARQFQDLKGFVPGGNIWYLKAGLDHLLWQNVMEYLSPGYLASVRQRTMRDFNQDWWWQPGELSPERAPDFSGAIQ